MNDDRDTMPRMKCEHPSGCWRDDEDGARCLWCEESAALRGQIAAITEQIEAKAIVVKDGSVTIEGGVGYLALHGGSLEIEHLTCTNVQGDAAYSVPKTTSVHTSGEAGDVPLPPGVPRKD